MKRIVSLAAAFALSCPVVALADEPKPEPSKPAGEKSAIDQAGTDRAGVARELKTQAGAVRAPQPIAPPQAQSIAVTQDSGGGVQVFVGEGWAAGGIVAGPVPHEHQKQIQLRMAELTKQAQASHREALRERVRRQRELTKQATKLLKQLDELKPDEQSRAQELLQRIERTQAQLQQTFGPQGGMLGGGMFGGVIAGSGMAGPGGGVWEVKTWPDRPGVVEVNGQRMPAAAMNLQPLSPTTLRTPSFQIAAPNVGAPAAAPAETMKAIEDLRRQIDQLRGEVRKLSEKK